MDADPGTPDEPTPAPRRYPLLLGWAFLFGVTVFVATSSPTAGVVLPLFAGGARTVTTGRWVLRFDPDRTRARISFAFYLATACWQSSASALTAIMVFAFLSARIAMPNFNARVETTLLVLFIGLAASVLIGFGATCAAIRDGRRVWIHPKLGAIYAAALRSPHLAAEGARFNYAVFIVGTSLLAPIVALCGIVLVLISARNGQAAADPPSLIALFVLLLLPFGSIPLYAWASSRIVARSPRECWPFTQD